MEISKEELQAMLDQAATAAVRQTNLDNLTDAAPEEGAAMRIKQRVSLNGQTHWLTGSTPQDIMDGYLKLCFKEGVAMPPMPQMMAQDDSPLFGDYLMSFLHVFKKGQASNTLVNRERIIKNHIMPRFGKTKLNQITVSSLQHWLNELSEMYAKETILKIVHTMNPVLDSAVEDGLITRNPLRSKRIVIGGRPTVGHKPIPAHKMTEIRQNLHRLDDRERKMAALLSYTGMRFEEVLGVKWEDFDFVNGWVTVRRAVVHPTRNLPEIKCPKTKTSERDIPIPKNLQSDLGIQGTAGFVLSNERGQPLSYTEARRSFQKIKKEFGLDGYSAHDFRDTCATEWREKGIPLDVIARMLGHAKTETTERKYVTYRDALYTSIRKALEPADVTLL